MTSKAVASLLPGARRRSLALALLALPALAPAVSAGDAVADRVLGQRHLTTSSVNFVDGRGFGGLPWVAVDRSATPARVWVSDVGNNRVLGWRDVEAFRRGRRPDLVLGQPDLFTGETPAPTVCASTPPSADRFCGPWSLAIDGAGHLYVVDAGNERVLGFRDPFATDGVADLVIGQRGFDSREEPFGPWGIAVDPAGNLYVTRVTWVEEYDRPFATDTVGDRLLNEGSSRSNALGVATDARGNVYVAATDADSRDVIEVFVDPLATDLAVDRVIALEQSFSLFVTVAVDDAGRVYATLQQPEELHVYDSPITGDGRLLRRLGMPGDLPFALAFDERGSLLVGDGLRAAVLIYDSPLVDELPDRVVGQPDLAAREPNRLDARGLELPRALALDGSVSPPRLYVLDAGNSRVLGWRDATGFANGAPADLVIGQPHPGASGCNNPAVGGLSARSLCVFGGGLSSSPTRAALGGGLAVDRSGNLWVADTFNHRVLQFERPFETDAAADRVLGQRGSFTTGECNRGGLGASSLCHPGALAVDARGKLWVADLLNSRVLLFDRPGRSAAASKVFGQQSFSDAGCNAGGVGRSSLCIGRLEASRFGDFFLGTSGLAVDRQGRLWVSDWGNSRVLVYLDAAASDTVADKVIGQPSFSATGCGLSARRLCEPAGLAVDAGGDLWVADTVNHRVVHFDQPLRDPVADLAYGQPDLTSNGVVAYVAGPETLWAPFDVEVAATGEVLIADTFDNRVLLYEPE